MILRNIFKIQVVEISLPWVLEQFLSIERVSMSLELFPGPMQKIFNLKKTYTEWLKKSL